MVIRFILPAVTVAYFAHGLATWRSPVPCDFYQFWTAGRAVRTMALQDLYDPLDRQRIQAIYVRAAARSESPRWRAAASYWHGTRGLEFAGTPLLYAGFSLLATESFDASYTRFQLVSLVAYGAGVVAFCWLLGFPPWATCLALIAATQATPFRMDLRDANVAQLQIAGLAAVLVLDRVGHRGSAAFVLGILVLAKPTLAPVAALLGIQSIRERTHLGRQALGLAAAAALALALPAFLFGPETTWAGWLRGHEAIIGPYERTALLGHYLGPQPVWVYAALALALVAAVAMRQRDRVALVGSGCCIALLAGPLVHGHYWLLALPAVLYALRPGAPYRLAAGLAGGLLALPQHALGLSWPDVPNHGATAFAATGVLLLLSNLKAADLLNGAARKPRAWRDPVSH